MVNYEEKFHNLWAVCLYSQSSRRKISLIITIKFNRRIDFRLGCYSYPHKDEKAQIELNFLNNTVEIENFKTCLKTLCKILIDNQWKFYSRIDLNFRGHDYTPCGLGFKIDSIFYSISIEINLSLLWLLLQLSNVQKSLTFALRSY